AHGTVSLARALSKLGICSRSQAEQAIRDGRVRVNGRRVTDASRRVVPESDAITMDDVRAAATARTYVMINKPRGLLTTRSDPKGRATVYDRLADPSLPFMGPVGRLDQASEGLLLFSNDTQWANAISAPESHVRKTYHVQVDRVPDDALLTALRRGVTAAGDGERLVAARVELLRAGARHGWLLVELDEGRNRQIRRMLEALDVQVLRLVRVAIGPLVLGELAKGDWRHLTAAEVEAIGRAGALHDTRRRRTAE
ncbi:MAG TPA: pseudouridine synthase, partial [Gemmatimonadaceae bacterium]|nr:pseudouridine synthase [Gemmatimonadaceae bacterium]